MAKSEVDGRMLFTAMLRDLRPGSPSRLPRARATSASASWPNRSTRCSLVNAERNQVLYLSPAFERVYWSRRASESSPTSAAWAALIHS